MRFYTTNWRLPVILLAAGLVATAGCAGSEIQGVILDEDMYDPELALAMGRGVNSEFTDIFGGEGADWQVWVAAMTDEAAFDDTGIDEIRLAIGDFSERPLGVLWEQALETSWVGVYVLQRLQEIIPEEMDTSPVVARNYLNIGLSERILGESFCEMVYNFGLDGGFELQGDANYDNTRTVPRDSAFKRALPAFQLALETAEAAVDAGVEAPADDPLFDPQYLVTAAHGGLAQVYANLGQWDLAVQHAALVPDDYVFYEHQHEDASENALYEETFQDDHVTVWGAPAITLWEDDPRVSFTRCADFTAGYASEIEDFELCDDYETETGDLPIWRQEKYAEEGSDVEIVSGTEMRLLEAEAALRNNDLGMFTTMINRARAIHGLTGIAQPAEVGALEYPNAEDDAWSILDRERYLDLWLEGRRFWDLERWDHPYLNGHVIVPSHQDRVASMRDSCLPVPEAECTQNGNLGCEVLS